MKWLTAIVFLFLLQLYNFSYGQTARMTVTNPSAFVRADEMVTLTRSFLTTKTGTLQNGDFVKVSDRQHPLVVQYDDLNSDGIWDEAVFLYTFQPKEKVVFTLMKSRQPAAVKAVVRAHVRQRHKLPDGSFGPSLMRDTMPYNNAPTDFSKQKLPPYLTEGPGWENDKVGFRKYFDTRNANDIWGKVTSRMMLDEVGVDPAKIYHNFDSSWGMDILKVGKSLGAGGLALQMNVDGKDSLVRFGNNVQQTTYGQIADGPVRAIFRLKYQGWKVGSLMPIDAIEEISIWGGQYFYQNKVAITNAPPDAKLVTGLNNFYVKRADTLQSPAAKILYTYGKQSENADNLGLAVMVPAGMFDRFSQTPDAGSEVMNTYTVAEKVRPDKPLLYRYYVGWEKTDKQFAGKAGFEQMLKREAMQFANPLKIQ